jgi:hypothetical protein
MTLDEFRASIAMNTLPDKLPAELQALWHASKGDWETAHSIVQDLETPEAAWVHACLHRIEGDHSNASYWYARAGRKSPGTAGESEELDEIAAVLLKSTGRPA